MLKFITLTLIIFTLGGCASTNVNRTSPCACNFEPINNSSTVNT